jgi:hypothetical protein
MRIFYGLERLPRTMALDDPRLPSIELGADALRLNTIKLPLAAWAEAAPGHDAHWAALEAWLLRDCGDYNRALRRSVSKYLVEITEHVLACEHDLKAQLAPFHDLYKPQDWCWSALRPLPRAWWQIGETWRRADLAFWDGTQVLTTPPPLWDFWTGEALPRSPFRR